MSSSFRNHVFDAAAYATVTTKAVRPAWKREFRPSKELTVLRESIAEARARAFDATLNHQHWRASRDMAYAGRMQAEADKQETAERMRFAAEENDRADDDSTPD